MSAAVEWGRHRVVGAVGVVRQELSAVTEAPLWSLRPVELEELLVSAHAAAAQLAELTTRLTAEADRQDLAGAAGAPSSRAWLRSTLRLSPAAAKRQQLLGEAPGPRLPGDPAGVGLRPDRRGAGERDQPHRHRAARRS